MQGLDAWLTRSPWDDMPDEIPQPKCEVCGRFLKDDVLLNVAVDDVTWCDGQPVSFPDTYTNHDAAILDIIGWDHLGQSYTVSYPAPCGLEEAHEGHFEVVGGCNVLYRRCSAGHTSKEFVW